MAAIKLFELEPTKDKKTRRFQSQLMRTSEYADFIMDEDNIMKVYDRVNGTYNWVPYNGEWTIVSSKSDLSRQKL